MNKKLSYEKHLLTILYNEEKINSQITIEDNSSINLKIQVSKEMYDELSSNKNEQLFYGKNEENHFSVKTLFIIRRSTTYSASDSKNADEGLHYIEYICEYALVNQHSFINLAETGIDVIYFKCTGIDRILGINAFNMITNKNFNMGEPNKVEITNNFYESMICENAENEKLAFISSMNTESTHNELIFRSNNIIALAFKNKCKIQDVRAKINNICNLLSVIYGEAIYPYDISLQHDYGKYNLYGYYSKRKPSLNSILDSTFNSDAYKTMLLIKISEINNFEEIFINWNKWCSTNDLVIASYRELISDYDEHLIYNRTFQKMISLLESYYKERCHNIESDDIFKMKLEDIYRKVNLEEKEMLQGYLAYATDYSLLKLLKLLTRDSLHIIDEGLSKKEINKLTDKICKKMKDTRDILIHNPSSQELPLEIEEIINITHLYTFFFRILLLCEIGINKNIILHYLFSDPEFKHYLTKVYPEKTFEYKTEHLRNDFEKGVWKKRATLDSKCLLTVDYDSLK
jgi:hypothetical protein